MGQFSWFTQDTHHRIVNDAEYTIYMADDKGNKYREDFYEGYGEFGGKDFYELVAEMNGYAKGTDANGNDVLLKGGEAVKSGNVPDLRDVGIMLAYGEDSEGHTKYPNGDNPEIIYPSITESGDYLGGECPESDPDQGFTDIYEDEDAWDSEDEEDYE